MPAAPFSPHGCPLNGAPTWDLEVCLTLDLLLFSASLLNHLPLFEIICLSFKSSASPAVFVAKPSWDSEACIGHHLWRVISVSGC